MMTSRSKEPEHAEIGDSEGSKYFRPSPGNEKNEEVTQTSSSSTRKRKGAAVSTAKDEKQGKKNIPSSAAFSYSGKAKDWTTESTQMTANGSQVFSSSKTLKSKLTRTFFDVSGTDLARGLLGKTLVRMVGSQRVSGKIVETEAYLGLEDKAAHSYKGKKTDRTKAMFMEPGTSYVYNIYGMYCCLNISSQGEGCAVLLRALEPLEGIDLMREKRGEKTTKVQKDKEMTNGPSKLCQALQITKGDFNQIDLTSSQTLWLEEGSDIPDNHVIKCARINIGYAEDWTDKPLRFYVLGNECVSTRNKVAESTK